MNEMMIEQQSKQQAFDETTQAYVSKYTMENSDREENALKLDVSNTTDILPDSRWEWATPNWNDTLTDAEIFRACGEVSDTLKNMLDTLHPQDVIHDLSDFLNASFSECIKMHIVMLVAGTETVEGACRHCFGLYDTDSQELGQAMTIWRTLTHVLDTVSVFNAFLERAWHLNPTSRYFPKRYQEITDTVREAHFDNHLRQRTPYADPLQPTRIIERNVEKTRLSIQALRRSQPVMQACEFSSQSRRCDARHQREIRAETSQSDSGRSTQCSERPNSSVRGSPYRKFVR